MLCSFSPSLPIPVRSISLSPSASLRCCTLAPDQARVTESQPTKVAPAKSRTFRVLPSRLLAEPHQQSPPAPPHHWSVPIVGYFIERLFGVYSPHFSKRERFGPIHTSDYLIAPRTYLSSYEAICDVMHAPDVFLSDDALPPLKSVFGADAILVLDGAAHGVARAALVPAFSPKLFPCYFTRARDRIHHTWCRVYTATNRGADVRLARVFNQLYLELTIEMTTGVNLDGDDASRIPDLFELVQRLFYSPRFLPMYATGLNARQELMRILDGVVREKLASRAETIEKLRKYGDEAVKMGFRDLTSGDVDILLVSIANSNLCTTPGAPVDQQVIDALCRSMLLLWFAGYTTAASTSSCASFELGLNPGLYEKLACEQAGLVARANGDNTVTYAQIAEMPLLDSFLTEILRLYPAATGMNRRTACDVEILNRYVPKESIVFCDFAAAHRDPQVYDNPNVLIADRFAPKRGVAKAPPVLSFGPPGSPHYCVGAPFAKVLMKTTFAMLLREYAYELHPNQSRRYRMIPDVVPESGVRVAKFERRA